MEFRSPKYHCGIKREGPPEIRGCDRGRNEADFDRFEEGEIRPRFDLPKHAGGHMEKDGAHREGDQALETTGVAEALQKIEGHDRKEEKGPPEFVVKGTPHDEAEEDT